MPEKRAISICACNSTKTNCGGKWICDAEGEKCPGNALPRTEQLLPAILEAIQLRRKNKPVVPAPTPQSIFTSPMNPTERVVEKLGLPTPG